MPSLKDQCMMALLNNVFIRLKRIFLVILNFVRRAFCCRRRKRSNSGTLLPIFVDKPTEPNYLPNKSSQQRVHGNHAIAPSQQSWPVWETNNGSANNYHHQQHPGGGGGVGGQLPVPLHAPAANFVPNSVTQSNEQLIAGHHLADAQGDEPEPETDFFRDMTPAIKRQKKLVINTRKNDERTQNAAIASRLAIDAKASIKTGSSVLGLIDDTVGQEYGSWEDDTMNFDPDEVDATLRDVRLAQRERRVAEHQRVKAEREKSKGRSAKMTATKIS